MPLLHTLVKRHVEVPQQQSYDQPHLKERKIAANTVPSTVRERLVDLSTIIVKWRRRIVVLFR